MNPNLCQIWSTVTNNTSLPFEFLRLRVSRWQNRHIVVIDHLLQIRLSQCPVLILGLQPLPTMKVNARRDDLLVRCRLVRPLI